MELGSGSVVVEIMLWRIDLGGIGQTNERGLSLVNSKEIELAAQEW